LWQIGYTVNHNVRVAQIKPDERYKEGSNIPPPPSAPASGWGKSHVGLGSWGTDLIALGVVAIQIPYLQPLGATKGTRLSR